MRETSPPVPVGVTWHDAECGGYGVDLPLWERLADESGGPVLDLGAGTGRVAIHLASRGHEVVAVEVDPELSDELARRARDRGIGSSLEVITTDARDLDLGRTFPLVAAPMQFLHMLGGEAGRLGLFATIRAHLAPGGLFAATVLAEPLPPSGRTEPLPDVRDVEGWIHSSLPLEVEVEADLISIVRLRQLVSPEGQMTEEVDRLTVDRLPSGVVKAELAATGLHVVGHEVIAQTDDHVGSVALFVEARDG
jgi:SAM-dependent methyltransferase